MEIPLNRAINSFKNILNITSKAPNNFDAILLRIVNTIYYSFSSSDSDESLINSSVFVNSYSGVNNDK